MWSSRARAHPPTSPSSSSTRSSARDPPPMTAEVVGGIEPIPPTVVASRSRRTRLRELSPMLPVALLLGLLFFVPLLVMLVFSFWQRNANFDIVPIWTLDNYAVFFNDPTYIRTLGKTVIMGAAVTAICL